MSTESTPEVPRSPQFGGLPGSAWFSHYADCADMGWSGPHKHIEDALAAMVDDDGWEYGMPVYIRRGRKMKKAEMEEWGVDFRWQCDSPSIVIHLPNVKVMAHPLARASVERGVDGGITWEHREQRG